MNTEHVITLTNLTVAMRAKNILSSASIPARVIKPGVKQSERGCGYGVSVPHAQGERAEAILRERGIEPLRVNGR